MPVHVKTEFFQETCHHLPRLLERGNCGSAVPQKKQRTTVRRSEDPSSSSEKSRTVAAAATATATLAATDAAVNEAVGQLQSTAQKSNDPPKLKRESGDGSKDNDDMLGGDNYAVFDLAGGTTLQITSQSPRRFMFTFPIQPKVEVKASPDEIRKVITDPILGISIL